MNRFKKPLIRKSISIDLVSKNITTDFFNVILTGNINDIDKFMISNNININILDDDNNNLLHKVIDSDLTKFKKLSLVKYFINKKININGVNKFHQTPILLASMKFDVDIMKELINNNADLTFQDFKGSTPLHYIAKSKIKKYKSGDPKSIIHIPVAKHDSKILSEYYGNIFDL